VHALSATVAVPGREAVMAQASDENFAVASVLLGRAERRQLLAIYGVARLIDDIGDEAPGNRQRPLDWVDAELDRVLAAEEPEHPAMQALAREVRESGLPVSPFRRLVDANRRDQVVTRYDTFEELLGYCELSAAPVGELVLHVFGAATPDRIALSGRVCAGLQVTEHIQDVLEDYTRGRVYIPRDDLGRFGCQEGDLARVPAEPKARAVIAFEVERARALLREGAPLARRLPARPRAAVAGFIAGGRAALDAIQRSGYDVWGAKPSRTRRRFARAFAGALVGR
jgi:squalene synthase HpnC